VKLKVIVVLTAMAIIGGIEMFALSQGINGSILGLSFSVIAGIVGYVFGAKGVFNNGKR